MTFLSQAATLYRIILSTIEAGTVYTTPGLTISYTGGPPV